MQGLYESPGSFNPASLLFMKLDRLMLLNILRICAYWRSRLLTSCTLVPERREELTTEGGLDAIGQRDEVRRVTRALRDGGIEVSLFIDADAEQVKASHRADAQAVELHTGRYCEARTSEERKRELTRLVDVAKSAAKLGLRVAAGHGLDYWNVQPVARIEEITELNIGYSIVCRAVLVGLERAVRDMKQLIVRPGRA